MQVAFSRSLGVRLAGLILVLSGLALVVLTEVNRRAVERLLIDEAEVQALLSTTAVVDGIDAVSGAAQRMAQFIARDLELRRPDANALPVIARNALVGDEGIHGFSIAYEPFALDPAIERSGVSIFRSNVLNQFIVLDLAAPGQAYWERDWYREVMDKQVPVWSEPFFDQGGTDRNVVRIAVPFFREEGGDRVPAGAVAALIELDGLRQLANFNEFSDTSFTIIFSRTGRLLAHPDPGAVIVDTIDTISDRANTPELRDIRQSVLARRQGSLVYTEPLAGRRVHVNYKPAQIAGWGVIVGYDEAEFLKDQQAFRRLALEFLGGTLAVFGIIVIGVTRHSLKPLKGLSAAAAEIGLGNLDCTIAEPRRGDEVGALTHAFRDMRDSLKEQHLERAWASRSLEHQLRYNQLIIDSITELVFVLTKALNISRINEAVTRIAGYEPGELVRTPLSRIVEIKEKDALASALAAGGSVDSLPANVTTKNGRTLQGTLSMTPLIDDNRVVGGVVTMRILRTGSGSPF